MKLKYSEFASIKKHFDYSALGGGSGGSCNLQFVGTKHGKKVAIIEARHWAVLCEVGLHS